MKHPILEIDCNKGMYTDPISKSSRTLRCFAFIYKGTVAKTPIIAPKIDNPPSQIEIQSYNEFISFQLVNRKSNLPPMTAEKIPTVIQSKTCSVEIRGFLRESLRQAYTKTSNPIKIISPYHWMEKGPKICKISECIIIT
jgi:hypothetical protein